jgi:predicted RNase H-like HicB family nuclease
VASVATLLTAVTVGAQTQEAPESGQEVIKIWFDDEGGPPKEPSLLTIDSEGVFTASDEFEPVTGDTPSGTPKPAIQTIAADQLVLVAVIVPVDKKDSKSKLAMVDYNGHDYELKEGTKIGKNNGYVKEIADTYIVIEVEDLNDQGQKSTKEVTLRLSE